MRLFSSFVPALLVASASSALAATSWSFNDAFVSVKSKSGGEAIKSQFTPSHPAAKPVSFSGSDTLTVSLTTLEGKKAKQPHQAFLTLRDPSTELETSYPIAIKESGKGKVDITSKDIPVQFFSAGQPLSALVTIGSFGSSTPITKAAFALSISGDASSAPPQEPVRYKSLPEIHHIFRQDPKSPPKIITLFFTLAVLASLPILLGAWALLGANVNHMNKALNSAPVAHGLFFGSIVAMEGIFYLYYTSWNLFQVLPAAGAVGVVAFLSGSRALTEVQERRLAGQR